MATSTREGRVDVDCENKCEEKRWRNNAHSPLVLTKLHGFGNHVQCVQPHRLICDMEERRRRRVGVNGQPSNDQRLPILDGILATFVGAIIL